MRKDVGPTSRSRPAVDDQEQQAVQRQEQQPEEQWAIRGVEDLRLEEAGYDGGDQCRADDGYEQSQDLP